MLRWIPAAAVFLLVCVTTAEATTYYISKRGSDSNAGTSWSAPWLTLTNVNSTSKFRPGDTAVFGVGIWRGQILATPGTTADRTAYVDSLHFLATPLTYPTRRVAWIYGSDSLSGWTTTGTANVYQCTKTASGDDNTMWQGEKVMFRVSSLGAVTQGKWYYSGGIMYAYAYGGGDPDNYDMEYAVRQNVNLAGIYDRYSSHARPDGSVSDGTAYETFLGLGFRYGVSAIIGNGSNYSSIRNACDSVYIIHCYLSCDAWQGGDNASLIYTGANESGRACTGNRVQACSLGTVYAWNQNLYPNQQVEETAHGNCITFYSSFGCILDSNVTFGHQSENSFYLKHNWGVNTGLVNYQDTIRFNKISPTDRTSMGIRMYGGVKDNILYGNIIRNTYTGILLDYSGAGTGTEGTIKILNNTFYDCQNAVIETDDEGHGTTYAQKHNIFKWNIVYNPTGSGVFSVPASYWDTINGNMYFAASGSNTWNGSSWATWLGTFDKNASTNTTNPGFNNAANGDFSRPAAPVQMNATYGGRTWTKYGAIQGASVADSIPPNKVNDLGCVPGSNPAQLVLTWTAPGNNGATGTVLGYDIGVAVDSISDASWSTGSVTHVGSVVTPVAAGGAQTVTLTAINGLLGGRKYWVGVKAYDSVFNYGALSNIPSATTISPPPDTTPPNRTTNLAAAAGTSAAQLVLTWTAPGNNGSSGTASGYDIGFATDSITNTTWSTSSVTHLGSSVTPVAAGGTQTLTLNSSNGLLAGTKYWVGLKAYDSASNYSLLSNIPSATTRTPPADTVPPNRVTNLTVAAGTSVAQLVLTWSAPGNNGSTGKAAGYDIGYSSDSITSAKWSTSSVTHVGNLVVPLTSGTTQSLTLTSSNGLLTGTKYWVGLKAYDSAANYSVLSNIPSASTKAPAPDTIPPSRVNNLALVVGAAPAQLVLTWTAPGNNGSSGRAAGYQIGYSTDSITNTTWSTSSVIQLGNLVVPGTAGSSQSLNLTAANGLLPGTKYWVALKAYDSAGNYSTLSNRPSATTKDIPVAVDSIPPNRIADLTCAALVVPGQLILTWTAPGNDGHAGEAAGYEIGFSTDSITNATWSTSAVTQVGHLVVPLPSGNVESLTLDASDGLAEGVKYWVGIRAYDSSGNYASLSNIPSATTNITIEAGGDVCIAQIDDPPIGAIIADAHPILTVNNTTCGVAGAHTYVFQLTQDTLAAGPLVQSVPLSEGSQTTSWGVPDHLEAGRYYWRVRVDTFSFGDYAYFDLSEQTIAFPNPVSLSATGQVTFTALPNGSSLLITTISGDLVKRWAGMPAGDIVWRVTNESGNPVSPGTYLWYLENSDKHGKIVVLP